MNHRFILALMVAVSICQGRGVFWRQLPSWQPTYGRLSSCFLFIFFWFFSLVYVESFAYLGSGSYVYRMLSPRLSILSIKWESEETFVTF